MTPKEIANCISNERIVIYGDKPYKVDGYMLLYEKGEKKYSARLIDPIRGNVRYWVGLNEITVKEG